MYGLEDEAESFYFEQCENPIMHDYPHGRELVFNKLRKGKGGEGGRRGEIHSLSPAAVRRFRTSLRRCPVKLTHFVTVTFPPEAADDFFYDWKSFVRVFWHYMALECKARGIYYIWVREPQKNGNPHYHIMCTQGLTVKLLANRFVARYVEPDRARLNLRVGLHCKAIYHEGGAAKYMSKLVAYCSKTSEMQHEASYRHWARNFKDAAADIYEASARACDWLRMQYVKFYAFKFPLILEVPRALPLGPPLPF